MNSQAVNTAILFSIILSFCFLNYFSLYVLCFFFSFFPFLVWCSACSVHCLFIVVHFYGPCCLIQINEWMNELHLKISHLPPSQDKLLCPQAYCTLWRTALFLCALQPLNTVSLQQKCHVLLHTFIVLKLNDSSKAQYESCFRTRGASVTRKRIISKCKKVLTVW